MEINRGRDGSWQRSKRFRYQSLGDGEFLFLGKVHINNEISRRDQFREGCRKSKWKFKMAFAMKGGGSRGGLVCH